MNFRPILKTLVPLSWSGDAALAVTAFLEQLSDAVWLVHGQAMHNATTRRWRVACARPRPGNDDYTDPIASDDLPF
jgi:hypothetical protein